MQRGPLFSGPSADPAERGSTYPGVHRGQGMAGLQVPAFNAGVRPVTPSRVETRPPETTSSGMHREPLSSTPVAPCESNVARLRVPACRARHGPRDLRRSASGCPCRVSRTDPTPRELMGCGLLFLRPPLPRGSAGAGAPPSARAGGGPAWDKAPGSPWWVRKIRATAAGERAPARGRSSPGRTRMSISCKKRQFPRSSGIYVK
ncbi:uncharacterized protein LOC116561830 [Sapajus apella]|uniref:Uncharacterized protein LOC116561830 n=1 Tax=Sapajus apella TaxID=9515 RepID=A0A6J3J495_SAPAP|nr:uncharacterized protein LOC116561830 [Sapajus apella]